MRKRHTVRCDIDDAGTIVHAGIFTEEWGGEMIDHITFGPVRLEDDEDVEIDWRTRTARVVKKGGRTDNAQRP